MSKTIFISTMFAVLLSSPAVAQKFDSLQQAKNYSFNVYYSAGHQQRAVSIASRVEKAISYYEKLVKFKPDITLLVLGETDWKKYTTMHVVYGMPHYDDSNKQLFLAATDNALWKSFLPPMDKLPQELRESIQKAYKTDNGGLSMQPFFDLLAIHELGHAFQFQGDAIMPRKWMGELFANILLYTYVAENEREQLPALTVFPRMVVAGGAKEFTYTTLHDLEERYHEIGRQHPKNYGWYQCRWHSAAATIYDQAGKQVCLKLWNAFKNKKVNLGDDQLVVFLDTNVDKSVADVMRNWDTVR